MKIQELLESMTAGGTGTSAGATLSKPLGKMIKRNSGVGEDLRDPKDNPCWKGYKPVGTKKKGGRTVPNCVPKE